MNLAKPGSDVSLEFTIGGQDIRVGAWLALLTSFFIAVIVFLKKKPFVAVLGIGFLPIGIIGAIRLGKPGSRGAPDPLPTTTDDDAQEESPTHAAPTSEPTRQRRHQVTIP
jgi:hypothetical protein